jgi:hypothetical protein
VHGLGNYQKILIAWDLRKIDRNFTIRKWQLGKEVLMSIYKFAIIILVALIFSFSDSHGDNNIVPEKISKLVTIYSGTKVKKNSIIDNDAVGFWSVKLGGTIDAKEVFDFYEDQMKTKTAWIRTDKTGNGDGDHVIFSNGESSLKIVVWESLKQIIITLGKW